MSVLGSFLREERERQKLTFKDISDKTAIRTYILEVLEEGKFDELPSYVHAHGFLAQYSRVLGLDFQTIIKPMFDEECPKDSFGSEPDENMEKPEAIRQSDFAPNSSIGKILIIVVLAVVVVAGIFFAVHRLNKDEGTPEPLPTATFGSATSNTTIYPDTPAMPDIDDGSDMPYMDNLTAQDTEAVSMTETDITVETDNTVGTENTTPAPVAAVPTPNRVTIRFNAECWVNYLSDNGATGDFIAVAGSERVVTFDHYFRVHLGNSAAASVVYNGNTLSGFGGTGQPIRNLYFVLGQDGTLSTTRTAPAVN